VTLTLDPSQRAAVEMMLTAPLSCITGGAGVGKTTCLKEALTLAKARGERVHLAASTGKAARRMAEATGAETTTIHRLLAFDPTARGPRLKDRFLHGERDPLSADLVIVDEASMIDVELAEALLLAIASPTRLALIGDVNQLPPVGAGRVFADLIESGRVPVARLTTLHRSAAASWVATQSREVLAGRVPDLALRDDFEFVEHEDRSSAVEELLERAVERIGDSQVIVPQNTGPCGTDALNAMIQSRVTPASAPGWKIGNVTIRKGDRVIQTRNDYNLNGGLGVMNGEIGSVAEVGEGSLKVRFEDAVVDYSKAAAKSLRLAYALTCHKMQGSETPHEIVLVHSTHTRMLTRGWLYTAITRARESVTLIGDRKGIERAVRDGRDATRNSGLIGRIQEAGEEAA
jgi:exodeoxyribonuclease V alpha subunit